MNAASFIGWLDSDSVAQDRISELLRAFDEPGTLDSLGFGTIRDTLAEAIAPGVSTIQTRLRYFLFIPWICRHVEHEGWRAPFDHRLRHYEAKLIERLRHLGPNNGVIGYQSGRDLKRMPSSAYWAGLRAWGIRTPASNDDMSMRRYGALVEQRQRRRAGVDDRELSRSPQRLWAELPPPPAGFLAEPASMQLAAEEASWLLDKLQGSQQTQSSPLAVAAAFACGTADAAAASEWALPWHVPAQISGQHLKDQQRELLRHARCVSDVTYGPQVLYNLLLAELASITSDGDSLVDTADARIDRWNQELAAWADDVSQPSAAQPLRYWFGQINDPNGLWAFLERLRGRPINPHTKSFVNDLARRAVESPGELAGDPEIRTRITDREAVLKGARARLGNRQGPLAAWIEGGQPFMGGRLDYRWPIVNRYLVDFAEAGVSNPVTSNGRDS